MFRSALRTLVPLRGFVSSRLCSGPGQISEGEKKIADLLRQRFPTASSIVVDDISGGCGSMYQVAVESEDFKGKAKVQQHKMVTETLQKEIADMHGIVITTKVPKKV
uniref:BolA-like protein 3 n=1 Tax=Steinernema glaseri TaxID=37863 RepID=A0A1I7YI94_9BILA